MKQIPLVPRKIWKPTLYALIDDSDYDFLSKFDWWPNKCSNKIYAATWLNGKNIYMHQLLLPCEISLTPDHINGNGLDNQRFNLRLATHSQQMMNRKKRKGCSSDYKGVYWDKRLQLWVARLKKNKILLEIGHFYFELDAAQAYNRVAKQEFGEFASLNKIKG